MLKDILVKMMAMVDPKLYKKYIMTNYKGQLMLYMKIYKALHGLLRSTLLFYRKLVKDLEQSLQPVSHTQDDVRAPDECGMARE